MKAIYFIHKCLVCPAENDVLQRWLRMGPQCYDSSHLFAFMPNPRHCYHCSFSHVLSIYSGASIPHFTSQFSTVPTSSEVGGMDPQTRPVAARISGLLAIHPVMLELKAIPRLSGVTMRGEALGESHMPRSLFLPSQRRLKDQGVRVLQL